MTHARIAPGCRRLTPLHVQVQAIAECFEGLSDTILKGQVLAAFKQAARPLGLSPRLRDAIETIPEAFVLWDAEDRLVLCNSHFQRLHRLPDSAVTPGT